MDFFFLEIQASLTEPDWSDLGKPSMMTVSGIGRLLNLDFFQEHYLIALSKEVGIFTGRLAKWRKSRKAEGF